MNWPLIAAIISFVAGLIAALYWYLASRVNFMPFSESGGRIQRLDPLDDPEHWVVAIDKTLQKSGKLNRTAAAWTAASVLLSAISAAMSALGHP